MNKKSQLRSLKILSTIILAILTHIIQAQSYYGPNFAAIDDAVHNTDGTFVLIDNPVTNFDSTAILLETPSTTNLITANGNFSTYLAYDFSAEKWTIFDESISDDPIPLHMKFNIVNPISHGTAFQQVTEDSIAHSSLNFTTINNQACNADPGALLFVKHTWIGALDSTQVFDTIPVGVFYNSLTGFWNIRHENDNTELYPHTAFNVFVADTTGGRAFIHTTVAADTFSSVSIIYNPLIDGDLNAIIIITPNQTPYGNNSGLDSIPVGVYYNGRNWGIYHQNLSHMHLGISYNVLVASAANATGIANIPDNDMHFQVYPNPASDEVNISYTMKENTEISIKLYATDGREISTMYTGTEASGNHSLKRSVSGLSSGTYYIELDAGESRSRYPLVVAR